MEVRVRTVFKTMVFAVDPLDSVSSLRVQIAQVHPAYKSLALVYNQQLLSDSQPLSSYDIHSGSVLFLMESYRPTEEVPVQVHYYGKRISAEVPRGMAVEQFKAAFSARIGLYPTQMKLSRFQSPLPDSAVISELSEAPVEVTIESVDHVDPPDNCFPVLAKLLTGETQTLQVTRSTEIEQVKKQISEKCFVFWDNVRLIHAGKCVYEPNVIGDYFMGPGSVLHVVLRIRNISFD